MKLHTSTDLELLVGCAFAFAGLFAGQYWWICGGSAIFISALLGEELEVQRLKREFPID